MSKTVRIIALVLVALMILSLIPTVAFGDGPYAINVTVSPATGGSVEASKTSANKGEKVTLTATAETGYRFDYWSCPGRGIDEKKDSQITFSMGAPELNVTAVFVPIEYSITVTNDGNGTASADVSTAAAGTEITLTPNPNTGYHFKGLQFTPDGVIISGNSFTMPAANVEVKAVFEADPTPVYYKVRVSVNDSSMGSASASQYDDIPAGGTVTFNANPASGYVFTGWSGIDGTAPSVSVTVTSDLEVTAYFAAAPSPVGHKLVRYPYVAPTASAAGQREHWRCEGHCDLWFWDSAATDVITNHNDVIIPAGHDTTHSDVNRLVFVDYEPATCEYAGHAAHYMCPFCKRTFDEYLNPFDPYLKPINHRWSHWRVVRRPTPTKPGLEKCTCYNCGEERYFTIYYNENPKTGDESNMALWISLAAVALLGTAGAFWYMKRKKKN